MVTLIGDCFRVGSTGGAINDVLFQTKYEDEVYKLLLRRAKRHADLERTWAPAQRPQAGGGDPA